MKQERSIRMDEISIRLILRDLLMNLIFLILAALIAVMGVRIYQNIVYVPEFTSTATLAISARGTSGDNAYSSLATANSMADVFSEVFQSEIMKEKIEESGVKINNDTSISSELIPETNLLVLNVTADNPDTAYTVIQVVLDNYHSVSDYLFGNAVIEVVMEPQVPVSPSNTMDTSRMQKMGALGAFCLAALLIILCSVMRDTVRTVPEAERKIEGSCLGIISHEEKNRTLKSKLRKVNKGLLITNPLVSFRFEEAYNQLASKVDYQMQKTGGKILLVGSVAENEGKSTVAANLALALANRNKRVLLMDVDFKKPALYKLFDCSPDMPDNLMAYLKGEAELETLFSYDKQRKIFEIFNRKSTAASRKVLKNKKLKMLIDAVKNQMDYVILDTAPMMVGVDAEILTDLSEASILVVRQDYVKVSDLNDSIEALRAGRGTYLGYVLNDFQSGLSAGQYGRYGAYGKYNDRDRKKAVNKKQGQR